MQKLESELSDHMPNMQRNTQNSHIANSFCASQRCAQTPSLLQTLIASDLCSRKQIVEKVIFTLSGKVSNIGRHKDSCLTSSPVNLSRF